MQPGSDRATSLNGKIRDYFLPENALQGEEIPTYILWKDIEYDKIEVITSNILELKEIYNVDENNYNKIDNKIIINSVEVDGYLGILFETERKQELLIKSTLKYTFFKEDSVLHELICELVLFRPELEISYTPDIIKIRNEIIPDIEKIKIENIGEGTLMIRFFTTDKSEAKLLRPKRLREFVSSYTDTFNEEVENIKDKYGKYDNFFEDLKYLINTLFDPGDEKVLSEFKEKADRVDNALESNEELLRDIIRIFVHSFLKNINILTVMERFLDYLRSIERNRVSLLNPLDSINLSEGDNMIELVINNTDLLNSKISPIIIKPIIINTDKEMDLPIYDLFRWSEGDKNDI